MRIIHNYEAKFLLIIAPVEVERHLNSFYVKVQISLKTEEFTYFFFPPITLHFQPPVTYLHKIVITEFAKALIMYLREKVTVIKKLMHGVEFCLIDPCVEEKLNHHIYLNNIETNVLSFLNTLKLELCDNLFWQHDGCPAQYIVLVTQFQGHWFAGKSIRRISHITEPHF